MILVYAFQRYGTIVYSDSAASDQMLLYVSGYFKGQLIPAQQPKLFTGGIMRSYQIDGMEWIKVSQTQTMVGKRVQSDGTGSSTLTMP